MNATLSVVSPETAAALVERLVSEGLISMSAAAKLYGCGHGDAPTHKSTVGRHALRGVKLPNGSHLKLESIRVHGQLRTSRQAVLRFFARQTEAAEMPDMNPVMVPRSPKQRTRAAAKAAAELDSLGIK
ncbi:MAG: hypothetical protein C0467_15910 [Planctomycetaceae bacterium]|nr:hypothetical protein [Planctomycetaceae bacterium]